MIKIQDFIVCFQIVRKYTISIETLQSNNFTIKLELKSQHYIALPIVLEFHSEEFCPILIYREYMYKQRVVLSVDAIPFIMSLIFKSEMQNT